MRRWIATRMLAAVGLLLVGLAPVNAQTSSGMPSSNSSEREASDADSNVGYIDSAVLRDQMRLRYDAAFGLNRPDRAEYFYPKFGFYRFAPAPYTDPKASGPQGPVNRVDYQEANFYLEKIFGPGFSGFVEVPFRFVHDGLSNDSGLGDINAGVKLAIWRGPTWNSTFQFRTYCPSGNGSSALGTDHVSLEPALLSNCKLMDAVTVETEVRYWASVGGSNFAGDLVRYGIGISYGDRDCEPLWISPIAEFVGWTILSGKETTTFAPGFFKNASGDTIVNAKLGIRAGIADRCDWYVGYGRALTGARWYEDDIRAEFRVFY